MALHDPRTRMPSPGVARTRQVVAAARERTPAGVRHRLYQLWSVVVRTVGICMRNRVTGLAAEAAFFAILSLPPLVFALAGTVGYVFDNFPDAQLEAVRASAMEAAGRALTEPAVQTVVSPILDDVLTGGGRYGVISVGFVLALWSGSRALNVFIDTITIMYGLGGKRGIVSTRALSFSLYLIGMVIAVAALPLAVAGPGLVREVLPDELGALASLYWPVLLALVTVFLAMLYHLSVPVRTSWWLNLPGAAFTLFVWVGGSYVLRSVISATAGGSTSIYGPLAAPIAVLLWLYLLSIAVLIGAAVNAAVDQVWPEEATSRARAELIRRLRAAPVRLRRERTG